MLCFLNCKQLHLTEEMSQENSKTKGWKAEEIRSDRALWAIPRRPGFHIKATMIN